ncbi:MAG: wax ester/triacylglycerol synthase family O-acyltransferase [Solirubrobacteraceae bacterium]
MTSPRLSALDASFLAVETPTAHMHVGWVALFEPSADQRLPSFKELRDHIARRVDRAPRYRQKLATVPLGLNAPEWIDDPAFTIERHVYWAPGSLADLVDEVMSIPLRRDRPLWEMWICDDAPNQRLAIVGKSHHCMVDGLAAVELASLLLDPTPEPGAYEPAPERHWRAESEPGGERMLARGVLDLLGQQLDLLQLPRRVVSSPGPAARQTAAGALRAIRAIDQLLRPAPTSFLNRELSALRRLAWARRPLDDLRTIRHAYGTTINDVVLAAVAGGIRTYLLRRGEQPAALKVMVPVNVRSDEDVLGNHISFAFAELPCDDPDPLGRLYQVHASMSRCKRDGEPEGSDLVLKAASRTPVTVQQALSRLIASPRAFNLVVSNIPGPTIPMYMLGCRLQAVYPMVPLADHHAVSVGMITIHDQACFGVYADRQALPDVDMLAQDIDDAVTELLAGTYRVTQSEGSLLMRARAAVPENAHAPTAQPLDTELRRAVPSERIDSHGVDFELRRLADDGIPTTGPAAHAGGGVREQAQPPESAGDGAHVQPPEGAGGGVQEQAQPPEGATSA